MRWERVSFRGPWVECYVIVGRRVLDGSLGWFGLDVLGSDVELGALGLAVGACFCLIGGAVYFYEVSSDNILPSKSMTARLCQFNLNLHSSSIMYSGHSGDF